MANIAASFSLIFSICTKWRKYVVWMKKTWKYFIFINLFSFGDRRRSARADDQWRSADGDIYAQRSRRFDASRQQSAWCDDNAFFKLRYGAAFDSIHHGIWIERSAIVGEYHLKSGGVLTRSNNVTWIAFYTTVSWLSRTAVARFSLWGTTSLNTLSKWRRLSPCLMDLSGSVYFI